MSTNENGNLVDDAGNVAVDFVWGNFPLQPNDDREENGGELLDATLDNHSIAYEGWNGYPLYTPNTAGAEGAGFIVVPSVLGQTTANATDILEDAGFVVTAATAATNAAKTVTAIARTADSHDMTFTASGAGAAYAVGTQVVVSGFSGDDAFLNGTYTVTDILTERTLRVQAQTLLANTTATIGKLSGYEVMDASLSYKFMERYNFKAGVNNIADKKYATRRAGGYPGPGIMPGNGRTVFVSIGASF
jgi:outer membrane receptor for Fe3+-dicitrate